MSGKFTIVVLKSFLSRQWHRSNTILIWKISITAWKKFWRIWVGEDYVNEFNRNYQVYVSSTSFIFILYYYIWKAELTCDTMFQNNRMLHRKQIEIMNLEFTHKCISINHILIPFPYWKKNLFGRLNVLSWINVWNSVKKGN